MFVKKHFLYQKCAYLNKDTYRYIFKVKSVIKINNTENLQKNPCRVLNFSSKLICGIKFGKTKKKVVKVQVSSIPLNNRSNVLAQKNEAIIPKKVKVK